MSYIRNASRRLRAGKFPLLEGKLFGRKIRHIFCREKASSHELIRLCPSNMFRAKIANGNIAVNESDVLIDPCYGGRDTLLCEIAGRKYLLTCYSVHLKKYQNLKSSSPFSVEEIRNLWGLVDPWRRQADPVSTSLWQSLSDQEQSVLMKYQPPAADSPQTQEIVVRALNRIIGKPLDFKVKGFKGDFFNRFLLERAYLLALYRPSLMRVSIRSAREEKDFGLSPVQLPLPLQQEIAQYVTEGLTAVGIEHIISNE